MPTISVPSIGTTVKLIQPVVQGEVKGISTLPDGTIMATVEYNDEKGDVQNRTFPVSQLEEVE